MENTSPDKKTLRQARITAFVIAGLAILSLLFLTYGLIQRAEAKRLLLQAVECEKKYNEAVSLLEQEKVRAEENFMRAEAAYTRAKALEEQAMQNKK